MSAFIVEDQTINRLVSFLNADRTGSCHHSFGRLGYVQSDHDSLRKLAGDLFQMNCDAVDARYGKGTSANDTEAMEGEFPYRFDPCSAVQAYKAAQCLSYQCSEGDIDQRPLFKALEQSIAAIAHCIISDMPAYNAAKWE